MMKRLFIAICCAIIFFNSHEGYSQHWTKDILGDGYEKRFFNMADDYSGKVKSTIIRKKSNCKNGRAILYIHGYNDYFFQKEMGDIFVDSCYNFYAVDLRKYGRSLIVGQTRFEVRDLSEYFADIDSALNVITKDGCKEIFVMGHSTGGLTTSLYMAQNKGSKYPIKGLILNSPFLDMNMSSFMENYAIPAVAWYSNVFKDTKISQGGHDGYARSLLKQYNGEWNYNTKWKLMYSPDVTSGWIGAIHRAQKYIQKGTKIKVPILLMMSDKSGGNDTGWTPDYNKCDVVLDVNDISKYGRNLGYNIHVLTVPDGLHDLFLSRKNVRVGLYKSVFNWLNTK